MTTRLRKRADSPAGFSSASPQQPAGYGFGLTAFASDASAAQTSADKTAQTAVAGAPDAIRPFRVSFPQEALARPASTNIRHTLAYT